MGLDEQRVQTFGAQVLVDGSMEPDLLERIVIVRNAYGYRFGQPVFPHDIASRRVSVAPWSVGGEHRIARSAFGDVFVKHVRFPQHSVRIGYPELRLTCVTALDAVLANRGDTCGLEAHLDLDKLLRVQDSKTDVIETAACTRVAGNQR